MRLHRDRKSQQRADDDSMNGDDRVCAWTGRLSQLHAHIISCRFEIVRCAECREGIERGHLQAHWAECDMLPIACSLCHARVPRMFMKRHADKKCALAMVSCGGCGQQIRRRDIRSHYNQCAEAAVCCDFYPFGCAGKHWAALETGVWSARRVEGVAR